MYHFIASNTLKDVNDSAKQTLVLGHLEQVELTINDKNTKLEDKRSVAGADSSSLGGT